MFIKRFLEWIGIKQKLDSNDYFPPFVRVGDLWWCVIGENLGVEVSGKGPNFTRPVIVLIKFGRLAFFGIPVTTNTDRDGSWYVHFKHKGIREVAMLTQGRIFSYKRLDRKMGELDDQDYKNVKEAYIDLFYK
jgi:mRNA interferase MazF